MSDRRAELIEIFNGSPIRSTLDIYLSYDANGDALLEMPHHPELEHALGDTHGGLVATLLDNAGWFTAAARYRRWISTVELSIRLLEPARREPLRARGRLVRAGERLAVAEMEVRSSSGRLIAIGSGTFAVTSKEIGSPR